MCKCAEWRGVEDEELYTIWNGGQGVLVVVARDDESRFHAMAERFGLTSQTCGEIVASSETRIQLTSKYTGKALTF